MVCCPRRVSLLSDWALTFQLTFTLFCLFGRWLVQFCTHGCVSELKPHLTISCDENLKLHERLWRLQWLVSNFVLGIILKHDPQTSTSANISYALVPQLKQGEPIGSSGPYVTILSITAVGSEVYSFFSSYLLGLYPEEPLMQATCKLILVLLYFLNNVTLPAADILRSEALCFSSFASS